MAVLVFSASSTDVVSITDSNGNEVWHRTVPKTVTSTTFPTQLLGAVSDEVHSYSVTGQTVQTAVPMMSKYVDFSSVGDKAYDSTKVTAHGQVTVTDAGSAFNFSSTSYIETLPVNLNSRFVIKIPQLLFSNITTTCDFGGVYIADNNFLHFTYNEGTIIVSDGVHQLSCPLSGNIQRSYDVVISSDGNDLYIKIKQNDVVINSVSTHKVNFSNFTFSDACPVRIGAFTSAYTNRIYLTNLVVFSGGTDLSPRRYSLSWRVSNAEGVTTTKEYFSKPLNKLGEVEDVLDSEGLVTYNIARRLYTGEEQWTMIGSNLYTNTTLTDVLDGSAMVSTYFAYDTQTTSSSTMKYYEGVLTVKTVGDVTTAEQLKSWISIKYLECSPLAILYAQQTTEEATYTPVTFSFVTGTNSVTFNNITKPAEITIAYLSNR